MLFWHVSLMSPESFEQFKRMNHDLRTQLTVVSSGVALLGLDPALSDRQKELMRRINHAIEKADSILDLAYDELRKENE